MLINNEEHNDLCVGIDLGTTNSVLATVNLKANGDCQRRQPAAHGQCLPRCYQRRPQGLSRRLRQCPRHCQRQLPADRIFA